MERRLFLAAGAAACLARPGVADGALPVPPNGRIGFKVFRNGAVVGEHDMSFTQNGGVLTGVTNFAFKVTVMGLVAYSYNLSATEIWSDGVFQSLESRLDNNGTQFEVQAHKTAAGYDVVGINHTDPSKGYPEYTAPPDTIPLSYWNKAMLNRTVVNVATAHSYPTIVSSPGWNALPMANGGTVIAQRFDVTGKLHLTVWYDEYNQWAGLAFNLHGSWNYEKIT